MKTRTSQTICLASLLFVAGLGRQSAYAVTMPYYDEFPSSYGEGGNLGDPGVGSYNWTTNSPTTTTNIAVSSAYALSYSGLRAPGASSKGVCVKASGTFYMEGGSFTAITANSVYVSFLLQVNTNVNVRQAILQLGNSTPATVSRLNIILGTNGDLTVNKQASTYPTTYTGNSNTVALGTATHLVVARYTFNTSSSTDDTVDLWLDPAPGTLGNASAPTATVGGVGVGTADSTSISKFYLGTPLGASVGNFYIDEFRLGTNWASVTPPAFPTPPNNIVYDEFSSSYISSTNPANLGAPGVGDAIWTIHTGETNTSDIAVGSAYALTYPNLQPPSPASCGVAVTFNGTSHYEGTSFTPITTNSAYTSFLLNIKALPYSPVVIASLDNVGSGNAFAPRLGIILDSTNNLSINKGNNTDTVTVPLTLNTTYLVVARYNFNNSGSTGDTVDLWVNPATNTFASNTAPAATVAGIGSGTANSSSISKFYFGKPNTSHCQYYIDEIRVGTTWASITPAANPGVTPVITGIDPVTGGTGGGTLVNITGSNFVAGAEVQFGGNAFQIGTLTGSTNLTITTPANAPGLVNVTVANPSGLAATNVNGFNYVAAPAVPPTLINNSVTAGNLVLVWGGGTNANVVLLTSTNLTLPRANWTAAATNAVQANGLSTNTIPINPAVPNQFYLLSIP